MGCGMLVYCVRPHTRLSGTMLEEDDLGPADEALLDLLDEGRITAPYAAEEADYSLQYVRDRLGRLVEHANARKVYDGLYELVDDPRTEDPDQPRHDDGGEPDTPAVSAGRPSGTPDVDAEAPGDPLDAVLDELPSTVDPEAARDAILAAREVIRRRDGASKKEIVQAVIRDHPLGYNPDDALAKIEAGDRYRGAWWRKVVKPGLEALDDVEKPTSGGSKWR